MRYFKIELIYLRKLQAIAELHNTTLNIIINQAVEMAIHSYEKENGVIAIDYDKLNDEVAVMEEQRVKILREKANILNVYTQVAQ